MQILIAGDLVPTQSNIELFENSMITELLGRELSHIWESADERVFNLEVPLADVKLPIDKAGPNLIAPSTCINGIKGLNPSVIGLANNHIFDHGANGLNSTKELLSKHNIEFVGAGDNLGEAIKPYIISKNGIKIGIYACCEREFTIATDKTAGANPFDPLESFDHIFDLKKECDYVLVLYHSGKEHYRYPSPNLQKICRKMIAKGADWVICQHSHCIGCFEEYRGGTIIYGQGNFIFDYMDNEFWESSLIIALHIEETATIEYLPLIKSGNTVRLASEQEKLRILSQFYKRSEEILKEDFVDGEYKDFAQKNIINYLSAFCGYNKWLSRIDRYILNGFIVKKIYNRKKLLHLMNYIECEAHYELALRGIKEELRRK